MKAPLFIICSPLAGVGKTLLARLLIEFIADERAVEAFDINPNRPSLIDYLPEFTSPADLGDTRGQMRLFDRLIGNDGAAAVVDLGQGAFERFFTLAAQVGLAEELNLRQRRAVVLFLANPDPNSVHAYAVLQRWLAGIVLVPVCNEVLPRPPSRDPFPCRGAATPLRLPFLAPGLRRVIADPAFSFTALRNGEIDLPMACHDALDAWLRHASIEFRELELRLLLADLRLPSLKAETALLHRDATGTRL